MADNTRAKATEETLNKIAERLEVVSNETKEANAKLETRVEFLSAVSAKLEERVDTIGADLKALLELMMQQRAPSGKGTEQAGSSTQTNAAPTTGKGILPTPQRTEITDMSTNRSYNSFAAKVPKMEFPRFDGSNPRGWVRKANQFFDNHSMEDLEKINFAAYYLEGEAGTWFTDYRVDRESITWTESMRF